MVKVTIVLLSVFLMIFYLQVQLFMNMWLALSSSERNKNYFKTPKGQEALMFLSYKDLQVSICYLPDVQSKLCLPAV